MTYMPGDIGLVPISGNVGVLIRIGQWLNGDGFTNFQHAFLYLGNGLIIQAEPGGAKIVPLSAWSGSSIYWCENLSKGFTAADRSKIVAAAKKLEGTPYSFADYLALFAKRLHIPSDALNQFVKDSGHLICSQLCAASYDQGGKPLYKTWTGWVTPLDLYNLDRSRG